jgi:hypothetical protein
VIPLYGFLEGDTLGLLVLAEEGETVGQIIDKLQRSASVRVKPRSGLRVVHRGRLLDDQLTVAAAGFAALDRIDVRADVAALPEPEK